MNGWVIACMWVIGLVGVFATNRIQDVLGVWMSIALLVATFILTVMWVGLGWWRL